jgi:hypothetical protein
MSLLFHLTTLQAVQTSISLQRVVTALLTDNEFERSRMEAAVDQFNVLFRYLFEGTEESHEILQLEYLAPGPPEYTARVCNHFATTLGNFTLSRQILNPALLCEKPASSCLAMARHPYFIS